jgi:hypothetical protein
VPRRDPVDGVGIVRNADTVASQLFAESYRSGTGNRRGFVERRYPLGKLLRPQDGGLPDPAPLGVVEGGEDLAPPAVEDGECRRVTLGLRDPAPQNVESADAAQRQAETDAEPAGAGDPDPDAGEGAGAEPDRDQVDGLPAAGRRGRSLDLLQEPGRVQGPPSRGEPALRLVQDLAVAPGAGDSVNRCGIEADDDQGRATP